MCAKPHFLFFSSLFQLQFFKALSRHLLQSAERGDITATINGANGKTLDRSRPEYASLLEPAAAAPPRRPEQVEPVGRHRAAQPLARA
jgi:hypothetical protein